MLHKFEHELEHQKLLVNSTKEKDKCTPMKLKYSPVKSIQIQKKKDISDLLIGSWNSTIGFTLQKFCLWGALVPQRLLEEKDWAERAIMF